MRKVNTAFAAAALWAAFSLPASAQQGPQNLFYGRPGSTLTVSATTTSSSVTLTGESLNDVALYVHNAGTGLAFCRWGAGAQTAVATDIPIPSGSIQTLGRNGATVFACITASGTATVYVSTGNGF